MSAVDPETRKAIQEQSLGGPEAVQRWHSAMEAIHRYAQASGCPLGADTVKWFTDKTAFYSDVMSGALANARRREAEG